MISSSYVATAITFSPHGVAAESGTSLEPDWLSSSVADSKNIYSFLHVIARNFFKTD